jgi:hypothetical protein
MLTITFNFKINDWAANVVIEWYMAAVVDVVFGFCVVSYVFE